MSQKTFSVTMLSLVLLSSVCLTGCGPYIAVKAGVLGYPVPISPFFQDAAEDKAWEDERYNKVPILGPLTAGGPAMALDPPSQDEVMRALEHAKPTEGGVPYFFETQLNNVRMTMDPISDYVDPVRVYPLIGPAQLHHAHYKCTIYFTRTDRTGWPIPYTTRNEDAQEVIYIDHNHLHMVGNLDFGPGTSSNY